MKLKKHSRGSISLRTKIGISTFLLLLGLMCVYFFQIGRSQCANSLSCKESLTLKVDNRSQAIFNNIPVTVPKIDLSKERESSTVLGEEAQINSSDESKEKHIYVDLTTQTLYAYEGRELFMKTLISSGLWGRTPTGEFTIWVKLRSTTMSGGSGDDYYYLPNVPHVMYFANNQVAASRGFSLHGTYWHNNFGHPMSHGCINMKNTDVEKLFHWANPSGADNITHANENNKGTKITIYGGE